MMKRKKKGSRAARQKSMKAPNRMALDQLSTVQQIALKSGIEIRLSEFDGSGSRFLHIMFEHYGTRLLNYWPSKGSRSGACQTTGWPLFFAADANQLRRPAYRTSAFCCGRAAETSSAKRRRADAVVLTHLTRKERTRD